MPDGVQEGGGLRKTFDSAKQGIGKTFDKATGAEFRRQFEEFTDAVTTSILGLHRDQSDLRDRLSHLESSKSVDLAPRFQQKFSLLPLLLSVLALILSIIALVKGGL